MLNPQVDELGRSKSIDVIVVLSGEDRRIEKGIYPADGRRALVLVVSYGKKWKLVREDYGTSGRNETFCSERQCFPLEARRS